ncbi:hypothetical protein N0V85_002397 [Neurospora sp. IMI 360204]|nr:hypothetical protein N0V85_002397 [Neurospora sp. IMI 360204]
MSSSSIGTGPPVLQKKTLSRQAIDDNRATLLKGSGRDVQRPTSHGGKNAHNTVQQPKCPQFAVNGTTCITSHYYPPLNEVERFGPYNVGLFLQEEDWKDQFKLKQPTQNMNRFKYCIESFHYPAHVCREPRMFQVDIKRKMEWHIQLRHFFADLPQQLEELEDYLSMSTSSSSSSSSSANNDNLDANTNLTDTAALANWTSYELPDNVAGPSYFPSVDRRDLDRFVNLLYCRRIVFSQRGVNGEGNWLTGRWLVVAYVFASTYEATRKLDVKALLSPGCSGTVTTAHGTGSGTTGRSTHYNTDTMMALRAFSWGPQSCIRSGDGPAIGRFYQLERRKKMASEFYIYRYGGGGGDQTLGKQRKKIGATTTTPTVAETADKVDTTITTITNPKKTDIVEETETSSAEEETEMFPTVYYDPYQRKRRPNQIDVDAAPAGVPIPQELEARCHLIDRLWPALMTGQYIPLKATRDSDDLQWDWIDDWSNTSTE